MYSWWWVELSPETCRVKPLRRINAIVASCWNYFTICIYRYVIFIYIITPTNPHIISIKLYYLYLTRRDISVGKATLYGLDGPGIEIQWGARFSAPVQTGPGAHPASCTMGTGSFPRSKIGRGVTLSTHSLSCRGHVRVEPYLYSPCGPYGLYRASVPVQGCTLPLTFYWDGRSM